MKRLNKIQEAIFDIIIKHRHIRVQSISWPLLQNYGINLNQQEISKELQFLKKHGYIKRSNSKGFRWIAIIPF